MYTLSSDTCRRKLSSLFYVKSNFKSASIDIRESNIFMNQSAESEAFLLAQVEQIAAAILNTFGEAFCEVLIHDFRQPDNSIVWIGGQLTRRHLGGAMSQIGLEMMAKGDEAQARINYSIQTDGDKYLKASMIPLRNAEGHVFAALCIKIDMTHLLTLQYHLHQLLSTDEGSFSIPHVHYSDSIVDIAQSMINDALHQIGMMQPPIDASQRVLLIKTLKQCGFFGIRRAVPLLADYLQVSRASVYQYLKEASSQQSGESSQDDE